MCPNPDGQVGSSVDGFDAAGVGPLEVTVSTDDSLPPLVSSSSAGGPAGDGSSDGDDDSDSADDAQLRVLTINVGDMTRLPQHRHDSDSESDEWWSTNTPVGPSGRPSSSGSLWWCGAADGEYMDLSRGPSWVVPNPRVLANLPRLEEMVATATHPYREQNRNRVPFLPCLARICMS